MSEMFCFQCEQTESGTGCTTVGVCGKTPEVAALQDLLVNCCKGVSQYAKLGYDLGASDVEVNRFVMRSLFSTMTNVNFDPAAMKAYIEEASAMRDRAKKVYEDAAKKAGKPIENVIGPATFKVSGKNIDQLRVMGEQVGVLERKVERGDDIASLQEMTVYGVKGLCAYAEHACMLGKESEEVYKNIHEIMVDTINPKQTVDECIGNAMKAGATNFKVMEMLDSAHTSKFGHPTPTEVVCAPKPGKSILVSGHDLNDLENILIQTQGTGVNVYTHGEMLPAHSYPGLKKYPHLAGHYGGPWQLQRLEFAQFPGSIVLTSNCLMEPRKSYKGRIFTRQVVGWPGVTHIKGNDYSALIQAAKEAEGFTEEDVPKKPHVLTIGFGHNTVLGLAGPIIDAIKAGAISRFFLIGGCDGSEGERSYFRELALASPANSVILTLGCGKYRINKLGLGNLPGTSIPRVLDMGQCNDAYSAITVAVALSKAFNTDVNSLPISYAISWFEQKAVAVLLTLLHLGIRNIRLGPNLPGFATPNMLAILNKAFNLGKINSVPEDMKLMMANK